MEIASREDRIRQLTAMLDDPMRSNHGMGSGFAESRIRELEDTIMRLQDLMKQKDQDQLGQMVRNVFGSPSFVVLSILNCCKFNRMAKTFGGQILRKSSSRNGGASATKNIAVYKE